jgi:DNA (cytosine-5)-methyltransferase 1
MMPTRGAAVAESRYSRLRSNIDGDLFNQNWVEVDVSQLAKLQPGSLQPQFDYIDLFSGAGGISCGMRMAGFHKLLSNEIDPDASASIRRNFPASHHYEGSIEDLQISDYMPKLVRGSLGGFKIEVQRI